MTTQTLPRTPAGWMDLARKGPGADQRDAVVTTVYRLWLAAFALKMLGSSWDISWHFKWLRDDFAPPHLLNTVGTVLVVALVIYQARFGVGVDRLASRLMIVGTAVFLVAIPLDVINHNLNGLDITTWSPSHAMLYLGTAIMLVGVVRGWMRHHTGRARTLGAAVLWGFFLENMLFPNGQQEYGTLALAAWDAGAPRAEPSLLAFAADQIGRPVDRIAVETFALPIDAWVYPAWGVVGGLLTLVIARYVVGARWTATAIAGGYLAYRLVAWGLLFGTGFPPSLPPLHLLGGAIMIDLVVAALPVARERGWLPRPRTAALPAVPASSAVPAPDGAVRRTAVAVTGTVLAVGGMASALWVQAFVVGAPPIDYRGFVWGGLVLLVGWLAAVHLPWGASARRPSSA